MQACFLVLDILRFETEGSEAFQCREFDMLYLAERRFVLSCSDMAY